MTLTSIGDQSQVFLQRRNTAALRDALARLGQEIATGKRVRPATASTGDTARALGLQRSLTALAGYRDAAQEARHNLGLAQTALGAVQDIAGRLGLSLLHSPQTDTPAQRLAGAAEARAQFDAVVQALNATDAGRALFGGTATDRAPLTSAADMLAALSAAIAGETTAAGVESVVSDWFTAPGGGYETLGYLGSDSAPDFRIAEGETVGIGLNGKDGTVRAVLKGLALAALVADPALAAAPDAQSTLMRSAAESLLASESGLIEKRAAIGSAEARIEARISRNAAEETGLTLALAGFTDADPYETASSLQEVQTRLEALYTVTARMSRLNLAEYLR